MLRPRIIPCLLVQNKGLVKTVKFGKGKYVGDPINAVRIFNEKEVDELVVLDIDATQNGAEPNYALIEKLAAECRMPFCYGGGISNARQARRLVGLGVEKVAISSAAVSHPELVSKIASDLGAQSVVVVLDIKKKRFGTKYEIWTHNASRNTKICPVEYAQLLEKQGAGEIVINSIACDGVMQGYDIEILEQIRSAISIPMTALGGAGQLSDIHALLDRLGTVGAAAGSLFVFKGALKAVLINYPSENQRISLYSACGQG